jgi:hypothetical protein
VLEDEAAVEHQHLDEVLCSDVGDVLGGVHGAGFTLASGDEADVALDDFEVVPWWEWDPSAGWPREMRLLR